MIKISKLRTGIATVFALVACNFAFQSFSFEGFYNGGFVYVDDEANNNWSSPSMKMSPHYQVKIGHVSVQDVKRILEMTEEERNRRNRERNARLRKKERRAASYGIQGWTFFKPPSSSEATAKASSATTTDKGALTEPLQICNRPAKIPLARDLYSHNKYSQCPTTTNQDTLLLLEGKKTYGRTGNNLIEFLHALQYAREKEGVTVGIMNDSWAMKLITSMWMATPMNHGIETLSQWKQQVQDALCIKLFETDQEYVTRYDNVIAIETRDLFMYKTSDTIKEYVEFQSFLIRTLFRSYNHFESDNISNGAIETSHPGAPPMSNDMCSVMNSILGNEKSTATYSVIHSRSLEGEPGLRLLGRISEKSGCDPTAALYMEPDYIKSILRPLGMLDHPIIFITDHQNSEILDRLLQDLEIGSNIRLVPPEASWIGGDMTIAIMANVFIGNPASTFSGFIAKSRVALGMDENYLFRARSEETGEWVDVCDNLCIFKKKVMNSMA